MRNQEVYQTLSFINENEAVQNKLEIEGYFNEALVSSKILFGKDERGNTGHYVEFTILN